MDDFKDHIVKISDLVAGTGALLIAILYITPEADLSVGKVLLIVASIIGLGSGWYVAQGRHWIMKIFLYAGMMVLCILISDLLVRLITYSPDI